MKNQFFKKIGAVCLASSLFVVSAFASCGKKEDPFVWETVPPESVAIGAELLFRNYIEVEDDAIYTLYVKVNDGEFVKQNTLVYVCRNAAEYSFKIERNKNGDRNVLVTEITVLPNAPAFNTPNVVSVTEVGARRTYNALLNVANLTVTPAELQDSILFKSVDVNYLGVPTAETNPVMEETITLDEAATNYTFARAGIYTFHLEASNVAGTAETTLTVNAYAPTQETKAEISYNAEEKLLTWNAVENATAYRVWVGESYVDVQDTSYSFIEKADGEYAVKVVPVYNGVYMTTAVQDFIADVGVVRTPLALETKNYSVSWTKKAFAIGYDVYENGTLAASYDENAREHTLKGNYVSDDQVQVKVLAKFSDGTTTEDSVKTISYGTVTLGAIDGTKANYTFKPVSNIEYIELEGTNKNNFVMLEFTGKNIPNVAFRAEKGFSELTCPSDKILDDAGNTIENPNKRAEWSPAGIFYYSSAPGNKNNLWVVRGFSANAGRMDGNTAISGLGISSMSDEKRYLLIYGYEVIDGDVNSSIQTTALLYSIAGDNTLTLEKEVSQTITSKSHQLNGNKIVLYGNIWATTGEADQTIKSVTFKHYQPSDTLAGLINGMKDDNPYKAQLKALNDVE